MTIEVEKVKTVTDFIFLGSKITADRDCSHEIKRCLLLGRKAMTHLDRKQRHYFNNKGPSSQSYGVSSSHVWMWELDYKKAECRRIDAFQLWNWRRLLRVPWTTRKSKQSILKEISPEYSLEGLMLNLKLQYFSHLMQRTDSLEKTLMLGKIEEGDDRRWDGWMASWTGWTWVWASSGSWWWTGSLVCCSPWGCKESDATEWLNWAALNALPLEPPSCSPHSTH